MCPVRTVEDDVWLVSFMDYDMAYFDMESNKVKALDNPFGPKVLGWTATVNYVVGTGRKACVRYVPLLFWWAHQDLNLGPKDYESSALTNWAMGPMSSL